MPTARVWERRAWAAGVLFVVALVAEVAIAAGIPINQDDSAAKIATELDDHRERLLVIAYLSVVYAVMFVIYLCRLHDLLRGAAGRVRMLHSWVLVGGVLLVALHGVSDIGITGLLGAKLASYGAQHDHGVSYTLYLMTFALDSVGDVFGSLFLVGAGLLIFESGVLPRWLGWLSVVAGILLFLQGFGLGGVIGTFGLVLDLIGFVLFLIFVLATSITLLGRGDIVQRTRDALAVAVACVGELSRPGADIVVVARGPGRGEARRRTDTGLAHGRGGACGAGGALRVVGQVVTSAVDVPRHILLATVELRTGVAIVAPAGVRMAGVARITSRRDARSRHVDASGAVRGRQPRVAPVVAAVVPVVAATIQWRGDALAAPVADVRRADHPVAVLAAGSRGPVRVVARRIDSVTDVIGAGVGI